MFGKKAPLPESEAPEKSEIELLTEQMKAVVVSNEQSSKRVEKAHKDLANSIDHLNATLKKSSTRRTW